MMASRVTSNQNSLSHPVWPARSHVALFVRCLHLLDLDLLEDWPGVTEELFTSKISQQNLQQRVKAVEWSLYRLFEVFDPNETKDKLRPFFPPATQLQSLNLRAALYRCLTELKKNGVLGKDAVLRKTMLDDCKGERFEEILASFAMSVLKKRTTATTGSTKNHFSDSQVVPAILSYRVSLQANLRARKEAATSARDEKERLRSVAAELEARLEETKSASAQTDVTKQRELRSLVNANWIGNAAWANIILGGVPKQDVFRAPGLTSAVTNPNAAAEELLSVLNTRLQKHQDRLSEWRVIAKDLKSKQKQEKASAPPASQQMVAAAALHPHFTKHQTLNLDEYRPMTSTSLLAGEPYGRLLDAMMQELASAPMTKRRTVSRAEASALLFAQEELGAQLDVSKLPTNISGLQQSEEDLMNDTSLTLSADSSFSVLADDEDDPEPSVSPSPLRSSDEDSPWIPKQQSVATTIDDDQATPVEDPVPPGPKSPEPSMSPSSLWMSLADRTRASMSLTGHQSMLPDPDSPEDQGHTRNEPHNIPSLHLPLRNNSHATLLERTRQSMSMTSNSSGSRRKAKPDKRASQSFPVNQFETPGRPQRYSEVAPSSGASTPRDTLFEEDADYASIFKSRPKLALSPTLSPQRRTSGLDSILEHDMHRLTLDSDEEIDRRKI